VWRGILLLFLLSTSAHADPPFTLRGTSTNQSVGALNANNIDQTTVNQNHLTNTITPNSCPANQALTGAYFSNGYTFGGTCAVSGSALSGYIFVSSASASSGNTISFTGLSSTVSYHATLNVQCTGSATDIFIRFNGSSPAGSWEWWAKDTQAAGGGTDSHGGDVSDNAGNLFTNNLPVSTGFYKGQFNFETVYGSSNPVVSYDGTATYAQTAFGSPVGTQFGGTYKATAPLSSIIITACTAIVNGIATIYQLISP
jgi:hypothetical protein